MTICGLQPQRHIAVSGRKVGRRPSTGVIAQLRLRFDHQNHDGALNDINSFYVKPNYVFAAIDKDRGGDINEGSVGGSTGIIWYWFKGGSRMASRLNACQYLQKARRFRSDQCWLNQPISHPRIPAGHDLDETNEAHERGYIITAAEIDAPMLPANWQG
jgi:D-aminopeptidase